MKFHIMDRTGHSTREFSAAERVEAEALFRSLVGDGMTAATRETGKTDYTVVRDPAKVQDETVFIPQLVGG